MDLSLDRRIKAKSLEPGVDLLEGKKSQRTYSNLIRRPRAVHFGVSEIGAG